MNDNYFSFSQLFVESNLQPRSQRILSYQQIVLQYKQSFQKCFVPPLFIKPSYFSDVKYDNWRLTSTPRKTKSKNNQKNNTELTDNDIPLPQVDPVATAYAGSYVSVQFSLRFFKYVTNPVNHIKLLIADNKYSQEALAYYKSNSLNIKQLEDLISCEEEKYRQQLKQVKFTTKRKLANGRETEHTLNLTAKQIDDVISLVKADVDRDYLDNYFQQPRALIIQNARFTEREYTEEELVDLPEIKAMMDTLVFSEGTGAGYGTIVRGEVYKSPFYPEFVGQRDVVIKNFSRHPQIDVIWRKGQPTSDAAGRYQIRYATWKGNGGDSMDFSEHSQDIMLIRLLKGRRMIEPLLYGQFREAIYAGAQEWASFPMRNGKSYYGQPVKPIGELEQAYNSALSKYK